MEPTMRGFATGTATETLQSITCDRIQRVEWLRTAIRTGVYHVPADVVAGSILRRLSLDDGETRLRFLAQQR